MPFMIAPMACSRTPKCRVRPYGPPDHILVWRLPGRNDGSPSTAVLLLSARSAEPPHSSGSTGASAASTLPEAARVAMPLGSAGNSGSASVQPRGPLAVGRAPGRVLLVPGRPQRATPFDHSTGVGEDVVGHLERPVGVE